MSKTVIPDSTLVEVTLGSLEEIKEHATRAFNYAQYASIYYDRLADEWGKSSYTVAAGHRNNAQQAREDMKFWKRIAEEII